MRSGRALAALGLAVTLGGCGHPPYIDLPNPVTGRVSDVSTVTNTFILTTGAGERYLFRNGKPDDPGMGQQHLSQHQFDGVPVIVSWRRDGYDLVAVSIRDGTLPASPTPTPIVPSFPFTTLPSGFPYTPRPSPGG
jgi:hypothetical protein